MKRGSKKKIFLQHTSFFMVFLILTLPFFSAQAYSLTITKATVAGSDGIENVMQSDNDYFTATVQTSGEVEPDQLQISYTKEEAFDECTGTICSYTSSQTDRSGQEMDYVILLLNNSIVIDDTEGTILIDAEEPEIKDFDLEENEEGDTLTISYEVEDTACDDCSGCAGIDYLILYQDEIETQQINAASECSLEDELKTSVDELNLEDGDHELCLIAFDNVGYESEEACVAISVDSSGPHFETGSLQVVDPKTGTTIKYIGADPVLVDIYINVSDASLSENTVAGDFSSLNNMIGDTYTDFAAESCSEVDEDEEEGTTTYKCAWYGLYIEGVSGTVTVSFSAQDNEGNKGTYSLSLSLAKDDTAPSVVRVYNEQESEDLFLKKGTNSVYADLDPTGSAFALEQVYLTFGLASISEKDPTDCWENSSYWTCVWNFSMSYSGTASSSLYIDATDDAGNEMEQYDVNVGTDSQKPEILSISTNLNCPTGSDVFEVIVNATDDSDKLFVTFYGENIRTSDEPITEECVEVDVETFSCTVYVKDIVSYPEDEDVVIEISDLAGNIAEGELDVSVCELEASGTPDLVTTYVGDYVEVDKLTLSYIDYPLYVPLTFSMPSSAHIVSKTGTCENTGVVYFIDQSETQTLMVVTLPVQSVPNATYSLNYDCSLLLTMQYGDNVYVNPEIEEIEISVELYGTPLGSFEESIAERIEWEKMWIVAKQEKIEKWVIFNTIMGIMCQIVDILTKADAVMSAIRAVTTVIAYIAYGTYSGACTAVPINVITCSTVGSAAWATYSAMVGYETFANTYHSIIVDFIWPVGYGSLSFGTVTKALCVLYSGKLCEGFSGLENKILVNALEQGRPAYYEKSLKNGEGTIFSQEDQQLPDRFPEKYGLLYDWDPYKSIHTAANCLYVDAIIYNLRKERQINCMYTTCLEENAKNGLPIDICDVQYKERECLYVDGAAWHAAVTANFINHLQLLLNNALSNANVIIAGTLYWFTPPCSLWEGFLKTKAGIAKITEMHMTPLIGTLASEVVPGQGMAEGTICHVSYNAIALMETSWFYGLSDWDFQANLEGTDYCAGY